MFGKPNLGANTEKIALEDPDFESILKFMVQIKLKPDICSPQHLWKGFLKLSAARGGTPSFNVSLQINLCGYD